MPESTELAPDVVALKSGLPIFYGRILVALERIAAALEAQQLPRTTATGRARSDA